MGSAAKQKRRERAHQVRVERRREAVAGATEEYLNASTAAQVDTARLERATLRLAAAIDAGLAQLQALLPAGRGWTPCATCGVRFRQVRRSHRFCSARCRQVAHHQARAGDQELTADRGEHGLVAGATSIVQE